jgi:hypothetical protein
MLQASVALCPVNGSDGTFSHSVARVISLSGSPSDATDKSLMSKLNAAISGMKWQITGEKAVKITMPLKVQ